MSSDVVIGFTVHNTSLIENITFFCLFCTIPKGRGLGRQYPEFRLYESTTEGLFYI